MKNLQTCKIVLYAPMFVLGEDGESDTGTHTTQKDDRSSRPVLGTCLFTIVCYEGKKEN